MCQGHSSFEERNPPMFHAPSSPLRIGIYGAESATAKGRGVGLWPSGLNGALGAAEAMPVTLEPFDGDSSWSEILGGVQGVVLLGWPATSAGMGDEEGLCDWCRERRLPLLAIDNGLLAM